MTYTTTIFCRFLESVNQALFQIVSFLKKLGLFELLLFLFSLLILFAC